MSNNKLKRRKNVFDRMKNVKIWLIINLSLCKGEVGGGLRR